MTGSGIQNVRFRFSIFFAYSGLIISLGIPASAYGEGVRTPRADSIDLSKASIVTLSSPSILRKAAEMLRDEVAKRTRIELELASQIPSRSRSAIIIGTEANATTAGLELPNELTVPAKPDGYALWVAKNESGSASVYLVGYDQRGALFATGRLLRLLFMARDRLYLDPQTQLATAPRFPLRGHQMGYRAKTNSYDAWTIEMWEQYYRDMVVFGMNAVELVPPRTDDHFESPHFPLPPLKMMIELSQLAADYGLEVWIWCPPIDEDYSDSLTVDYGLRESEKVFKALPRIDALFVPSGDPGEVHPAQLFPLMSKQKEILRRYHPQATLWSSLQNYDDEPATMGWTAAFLEGLRDGRAPWLDGMVFGPATEMTLAAMREKVPESLPIRRYPDITHSRNCQYEVPDWDRAFGITEGREVINPRPRAFASIFRSLQQYAIGFITYSEGCNDDVNKVVWSCLGWDPNSRVEDILAEYSRYFIGPRYEKAFALGLLSLEENWKGPLIENSRIDATLDLFQEMETQAGPQEKLNWRFQQSLYRAYYDAFIKARLRYETHLEETAVSKLARADSIGSLEAMNEAERILGKAAPLAVRPDWRARLFELAEALYNSVRMQLSVPRYQAKEVGRGANLDRIDVPLNNSRQLKRHFETIRSLDSEQLRLAKIHELITSNDEWQEDDWDEIIEEKLRQADNLWYIRQTADDLEHGPSTRELFRPGESRMPGLIGFRTDEPGFEDPSALDILTGVSEEWPAGSQSRAGYWTGYLEAPWTGAVAFSAEVDDRIRMSIDETIVIDQFGYETRRSGRVMMQKGRIYPVRIWYTQTGGPAFFRLYWHWKGRERAIVNAEAFCFGPENVRHAFKYVNHVF